MRPAPLFLDMAFSGALAFDLLLLFFGDDSCFDQRFLELIHTHGATSSMYDTPVDVDVVLAHVFFGEVAFDHLASGSAKALTEPILTK